MKAETSATLKVIAVGFLLIFLVFLGIASPFYIRQRNVLQTWPRTEAKVLSSEVVPVAGKRGTNYTARFLVEYRMRDNILTAMVNSGYRTSLQSVAAGWVSRFPQGSAVIIAYDPQDPSRVRLNPGYNRYFFSVPLLITEIGLIFAGIAAVLYVVARRADAQMRAEAGAGKG